MSNTPNIVSISGGKDSTAMMLLALERNTPNLQFVFADTGNEHPDVYDYLVYLEDKLSISINRVRADFSTQIYNKRAFVLKHWERQGVAAEIIDSALECLVPSGNPFLDLCIWKGRFPSSTAQFCTGELKSLPILKQVMLPALKKVNKVRSWQGIRRAESKRRSTKDMHERLDMNIWAYRPLIDWTAEETFDQHRRHGIKPNPLYLKGMSRVGCMPCINCRKSELAEITNRFPEVIDRIRKWEEAVSTTAKRGCATFFSPMRHNVTETEIDRLKHGIDAASSWSLTVHGGNQFDLFRQGDKLPSCSSNYGLCDTE